MPRTFSAPEQLYQPGTYGPYSVDSFTNANTEMLEWTATVVDWPTDPTLLLFKITVQWSNGDFARWFINGGRTNRDGTPATEVGGLIRVPVENDGSGNRRKANVSSGRITAEVMVPVRTAFTLAAV